MTDPHGARPTVAPIPTIPDGVLAFDKPAGCTSHDVVARVRRALGGRRARRVGHAGTLDPFATGVLLVLVGRATRLQRHLMALDKTYETVACLGARSTTGDVDGEIERTGRMPPEPPPLPTGVVRQRPPAYSAVKIDGRRAYALAREGRVVEMPEREVTVHEFERLWRDGDRAAFRIRCSSGTYVRSLVADLGDAYCEALRRTAIGPYLVEHALPVGDDPTDWRPVPLRRAVEDLLPTVHVDEETARRAGHGQRITLDPAPSADEVALVTDADLVALARREQDGRFHPVVGFRP
ncbi:MAG: tRNA pseudouridine(55) synthase TruB [Solirubrobacteraceae bacterium]|nr:tRNA pseudouridine(55) synthase TruB [Solirubrobacteraceae bacterium]